MNKFDTYVKSLLGESFDDILNEIEIPKDLEDIIDSYSEFLDIYINDYPKDNLTMLRTIRARKDAPKGIGTSFMNDFVEWADKHGRTIALRTGEKSRSIKGDKFKATTSSSRLKKFYRRFGFVSNYNKRDYRSDLDGNMHRNPRKKVF